MFGDNLIPHLSDDQITKFTPQRSNWFPIPLASEVRVDEVANRPDPHIDFKIFDDGTIRIGMRCNTVASVEKIKNILDSLQNEERQELISEMRKLDDSFQTQILAKIKETNYAHVDDYRVKFAKASNQIDQQTIDQIFASLDTIREEGRKRMKDENLTLNPETPVLDVTFVKISQDPVVFKQKLTQMKRMYEICLRVRTSSELRKERKSVESRQAQKITKLRCSKCGKEYTADTAGTLKFCDEDGMRIITVKELMD